MWTTSSAARTINYNLPPEMGMFVVAPTSFHHHHHHIHDSNPINPSDHHLGGPAEETEYLTNRYSGGGGGSAGGVGGGGIQFWQQHQQNPPQQVSYGKKQQDMSLNFHHNNSVNLLQNIGTGGTGNYGGLGTAASSSGTATCQDCGNQSKKDCPHRRCRTCCKSRGYDCTTHVKSTWVPASRRRERQLMAAAATPGSSTSGGSGTKKPRLLHPPQQQTTTTSHTSTSNTTPPRSFDATSSHQDGSFKESLPGQVRAPATFKCVRVTAVVDGDDEYAYQAVVKIGGHVFKGFLYDQGVVGTERDAFPSMSELNLGGGGSGGVGRNAGSSPILVQGDVYAAATGGALLGGSSDYAQFVTEVNLAINDSGSSPASSSVGATSQNEGASCTQYWYSLCA